MEKTRILVYSQKGPNMGGESCTVLRLRLMRNLAMFLREAHQKLESCNTLDRETQLFSGLCCSDCIFPKKEKQEILRFFKATSEVVC